MQVPTFLFDQKNADRLSWTIVSNCHCNRGIKTECCEGVAVPTLTSVGLSQNTDASVGMLTHLRTPTQHIFQKQDNVKHSYCELEPQLYALQYNTSSWMITNTRCLTVYSKRTQREALSHSLAASMVTGPTATHHATC